MEKTDIIPKIDAMITILGEIIHEEATVKKNYSHLLKHAQRAIKNLSEIKIIYLRGRNL